MRKEVIDVNGLGKWILDEKSDKFKPLYKNFKNLSTADILCQNMIEDLRFHNLRYSTWWLSILVNEFRSLGHCYISGEVSSLINTGNGKCGYLYFKFRFHPVPILKYLNSAFVGLAFSSSPAEMGINFNEIKKHVTSDKFVEEILSGKYGDFDKEGCMFEEIGQKAMLKWVDGFSNIINESDRFRIPV